MICPICRGATTRLFPKRGFWISRCRSCHHRCAEVGDAGGHVQRVYDDQYFSGGGAGYSDYLREGRLLEAHGKRYARVLARHMTPGRVLDVGAAAGFILKGLVESGWIGEGVEPNATMATYARSRTGVQVHAGTFEQFQTSTAYDLVTMIQVIAHFLDPGQVLQRAGEILKPGGHLLIETWNRDSWTARLFGSRWHEYSPPSVVQWFTPGGLSAFAARYGFHEVARGRPQKWLDGMHAKSLLRHLLHDGALGRAASRMASVIPDNLPIPYPAEDLFWILFQHRPGHGDTGEGGVARS